MKTFLPILFLLAFFVAHSQDYKIAIDEGDYGNGKEITNIFAQRGNPVFIYPEDGIDTVTFETDNGLLSYDDRNDDLLMPERKGDANVKATIKLTNGKTIVKTRKFTVIAYPSLHLQLKKNDLRSVGTLEFDVADKEGNIITSEFKVISYEISIHDRAGKEVFKQHIDDKLKLDFNANKKWYKPKIGDTLKISKPRLLWEKNNLHVFTKPLEMKIDK